MIAANRMAAFHTLSVRAPYADFPTNPRPSAGGLGKSPAARHITPAHPEEAPMQTRNKLLDDLAQLMSNALGVAQGAKTEAETAMKSLVDRWLADRNLVTREEFDAVRAMAQKAREENEALSARLAALEAAKGRKG
jgi:BMFP domain-containing protein YqiC